MLCIKVKGGVGTLKSPGVVMEPKAFFIQLRTVL
jgi:hypothetical protein